MRILVACEESGAVRRALRKRGVDAWSCDLLPARDGSPHHIQHNVLEVLYAGWGGILAFPPCTHVSSSGARWAADHWVKRKNKPPRWHDGAMKRAAQKMAVGFVEALWAAPIPLVALENPIGRLSTLWRKPDQIIQPWQFWVGEPGKGEVKATCLWLRGLPPLVPTSNDSGRIARIHKMPPGPNRSRARSETYPGVAEAMADQWGLLFTRENEEEDRRECPRCFRSDCVCWQRDQNRMDGLS